MSKVLIYCSDKIITDKLVMVLDKFHISSIIVKLPEDIIKIILTNPPALVFFYYDKDLLKIYKNIKSKFAMMSPVPFIFISEKGFVFDFLGEIRKEITGFISSEIREEEIRSMLDKLNLRKEEKKDEKKSAGYENKLLAGKKILIADDETENRGRIKKILKEGISSIEAADGIEAYNKALENLPDIIILDILMPKLNGFELHKKLNQVKKADNIKIIFNSNRKKDFEYYDKYVTDKKSLVFLKRPFTEQELLDSIVKLIK